MHNVGELYAFRFLVGLFESSFFPVLLYVLGSWYTKTELAKRVAIFHVTAPLGSAFGGYLQAAVYESLNGKHGLEGWRWLYIICGVSFRRLLFITCRKRGYSLTQRHAVHDDTCRSCDLFCSS